MEETSQTVVTPEKSKTKVLYIFAAVLVLAVIALMVLALINKKEPQNEGFVSLEEPGMETMEGGLVDGFPEVEVYPGTNVIGSYSKEVEGGMSYEASWTSDDTPADIATWYYNSLTADGWQVIDPDELDLENAELYLTVQKGSETRYYFFEDDDGVTEIHLEIPAK